MTLVRIIIINVFIFNIILWISHEILHIFRFKKSILLWSAWWGTVAALLLLLYAFIQTYIPDHWWLTNTHSVYSIILLSTVVSVVSLLRWGSALKKHISNVLGVSLWWIGIYLAINNIFASWIQVTIWLFFLLAFAEENLKTLGIRNKANKLLIKNSDLIICWLLSGLTFAFVENIVVSVTFINSIQRLPLFFIHAIFTSFMAYGILYSQKKKKNRIYPVVVWSIVILHTLYNIWGTNLGSRLWVAIGLFLYFLFTIVQYNSQSIYISDYRKIAQT